MIAITRNWQSPCVGYVCRTVALREKMFSPYNITFFFLVADLKAILKKNFLPNFPEKHLLWIHIVFNYGTIYKIIFKIALSFSKDMTDFPIDVKWMMKIWLNILYIVSLQSPYIITFIFIYYMNLRHTHHISYTYVYIKSYCILYIYM